MARRATFSHGDSVTEPTVVGTADTFGGIWAALLDEVARTGVRARAAGGVAGRVGGRARRAAHGSGPVPRRLRRGPGPRRAGAGRADVTAVVADPSFRGTPTGELLARWPLRCGGIPGSCSRPASSRRSCAGRSRRGWPRTSRAVRRGPDGRGAGRAGGGVGGDRPGGVGRGSARRRGACSSSSTVAHPGAARPPGRTTSAVPSTRQPQGGLDQLQGLAAAAGRGFWTVLRVPLGRLLGFGRGSRRACGDHRAGPAAGLHQAGLFELAVGAGDGVRGQAQVGGQPAHRRQFRARRAARRRRPARRSAAGPARRAGPASRGRGGCPSTASEQPGWCVARPRRWPAASAPAPAGSRRPRRTPPARRCRCGSCWSAGTPGRTRAGRASWCPCR